MSPRRMPSSTTCCGRTWRRRIPNFVAYANGNLASQKLIDPAIFDDKTIYPDEATMKSLYIVTARDAKTQRIINRLWTRVKTGK